MEYSQTHLWVDEIISEWIHKGIIVQEGTTIAKIKETEIALDIKFPEDFISLYTKANGFKDWDWTEDMFSIWSLERIIQEFKEANDKNFVGFCDYLINSHQIGFLNPEVGVFKNYDQLKPIALSFKEAIVLITEGSDLIY